MRFLTNLTIILFLFQIIACSGKKKEMQPDQTILFIIDGMACGTLERLPVPNLQDLRDTGVYYPEMYLILPAHLDRNDNPDLPEYYPWGCSLPNIPIMTGTIFVGIENLKQNMIQHSFTNSFTSFIVNDGAYEELKYGFDMYHRYGATQADQFDYAGVIEKAKNIIQTEHPRFLRIHLQGTGSAGYFDYNAGTPIWADDSQYRQEMIRADSTLGTFINWLKEMDKWDETVMIIMGDHGQNDEGWHAPYVGKAHKQPVVIVGKSIKQGKVFNYAESVDICPTIAFLNQVSPPAFSMGRVLIEAFVGEPEDVDLKKNIEKLDNLLLKHHRLMADYFDNNQTDFVETNKSFYTIETIGSWHKYFSDIESLITHQEKVLNQLEEIISTRE